MTNTSTAQGRYYLLNSPVASPGQCGVCGYGGNDRQYLDPRLDFEFYGSLYFCSECMASMAAVMGYIEPAKARTLELRVEEAERELVVLRAAVLNLENLHDALAGLGIHSDRVQPDNGPVASSESPGQLELPEVHDHEVGESESRTSESADESGRNDVHDTKPNQQPAANDIFAL